MMNKYPMLIIIKITFFNFKTISYPSFFNPFADNSENWGKIAWYIGVVTFVKIEAICLNILYTASEDDEVSKIRKACEITDNCFSHLHQFIKIGMTERKIAFEILKSLYFLIRK